MIVTVYLWWMLLANSWRPSQVIREVRKAPATYALITVLLVMETLFRWYVW